jgi:tetratricopeptide (TPR) repeat protein
MISASFIIKNEEKWLENCLRNIRPLVSEIIIADTGSTDRSKEIAQSFGAKLFDFKWIDDFSSARNFALSKASGNWILNMDADERLAEIDLPKISALTEQTDVDAFSFRIRNYSTNTTQTFFSPCQGEYPEFETDQVGYFETQRIKLFQNRKGIHFVGAVHELVESTVRGKVETVTAPFHHFGELSAEKLRKSKQSLYFPLLLQKVAENPNNWKAYFELGTEYLAREKASEALLAFENSLKLSDYPQTYSHLGHCYFLSQRFDDAEKLFQRGMELYPEEHDIRFNYATMKISQAKFQEAIALLQPLVVRHPKSFSAYRALGYCALNLGKLEEADAFLNEALRLFPKCEDALVDLGILRFFQGQRAQALEEAKKTLSIYPDSPRAQGLIKAIEAQV